MTVPDPARPPRYHLVMLGFRGVDEARAAHEEVKAENELEGVEIEGEAVIARTPNGEILFHEGGSAGIGAAFGAAGAGLIGIYTGPVVILAMIAGGALLGGVLGHFAGQVLPRDDLRQVAEHLRPGSSAYLAVVDAEHAPAIVDAYRRKGASALDVPIETEVASAIREGLTREVTRI